VRDRAAIGDIAASRWRSQATVSESVTIAVISNSQYQPAATAANGHRITVATVVIGGHRGQSATMQDRCYLHQASRHELRSSRSVSGCNGQVRLQSVIAVEWCKESGLARINRRSVVIGRPGR
jgi:hypothetical protein